LAVRPARDAVPVAAQPGHLLPERVVRFRPRTILTILAIVLAVAVVLELLWIARHVLTWILISVFLALAINPAVDWLQTHGVRRRGPAVGIAYLVVLIAIAGIGALFIPTLVDQVNKFVDAVPGYVHDLTHGRGRLGFLETRYHVVEKVRRAVKSGGAHRIIGYSGTALAITKSVIGIVAGIVTIAFLTFFMLLEGPGWLDRFYGLLPVESQPRWRAVGRDIYRTVGGYVSGNLLISLIAGVSSALVLFATGTPYSVALGLLVGILDLIPLAGATVAGILIAIVAFLHSIVAGIVVVVFFIVYQQLENHVLQPFVYGRTVQLSPLAVLISVLIGAEIAGVLGALAAIPVAGSIQVVLVDWWRHRQARRLVTSPVDMSLK
jgi:predicted PurR-regulated permease PerM